MRSFMLLIAAVGALALGVPKAVATSGTGTADSLGGHRGPRPHRCDRKHARARLRGRLASLLLIFSLADRWISLVYGAASAVGVVAGILLRRLANRFVKPS
jgi:hypothetical protein